MCRRSSLKRVIFLSAFLLLSYFLIFPISAFTETFNVTNEDELRDDLNIAESNGEDDTIHIAAGVYHTGGEPFLYESDEDFSLTIEGEGKGQTIFDGDQIYRVIDINSLSPDDVFVSIRGLTIRNAYNLSIPGDDSPLPVVAGIYTIFHNVKIENCEFIDNVAERAGDGWGLYASAKNKIILSANIFSNNSGAFAGGGAYISAPELDIYGNKFYQNSGGLSGGGGLVINNTNSRNCDASITNNIIISNTSFSNGGGLSISLYCDNYEYKIINNTLTLNTAENDGGGINFIATADEQDFVVQIFILDIYNNIVFDNIAKVNGDDIYLSLASKTLTGFVSLSYNDFSDYCYFRLGSGFCTSDADEAINNINEDPRFQDAAAGNVRLEADSPCINTGDPFAPGLPAQDFYGGSRDSMPDMGAIEYHEIVVDGHGGNGGCSIAPAGANYTLPLYLLAPALILIRRFVKRCRK